MLECTEDIGDFLSRSLSFIEFLKSMEKKNLNFKGRELSAGFLEKEMIKEKYKKAYVKYKDIICNSMYTEEDYYKNFNHLIERTTYYSDEYFSSMISRMEFMSSSMSYDQARPKSIYFECWKDAKTFMNHLDCYTENNLCCDSYPYEKLELDPFEFCLAMNPSKFHIDYEESFFEEDMFKKLNIFGENIIPGVLLSVLKSDNTEWKVDLLKSNARTGIYDSYECEKVDISENTLSLDDIYYIGADYSSYNDDACSISTTYVYSEHIDNFIKKSNPDRLKEFLDNLDEFFKYRFVTRTCYTAPIVIKKGDSIYEKLKDDISDKKREYVIVLCEFHWDELEFIDGCTVEGILHTKHYLKRLNEMLETF